MTGTAGTIVPEIIDCISEGRCPSAEELQRLAGRIWTDVRGSRSAFAWGDLADDSVERQLVLKVAEAAIRGGLS